MFKVRHLESGIACSQCPAAWPQLYLEINCAVTYGCDSQWQGDWACHVRWKFELEQGGDQLVPSLKEGQVKSAWLLVPFRQTLGRGPSETQGPTKHLYSSPKCLSTLKFALPGTASPDSRRVCFLICFRCLPPCPPWLVVPWPL